MIVSSFPILNALTHPKYPIYAIFDGGTSFLKRLRTDLLQKMRILPSNCPLRQSGGEVRKDKN